MSVCLTVVWARPSGNGDLLQRQRSLFPFFLLLVLSPSLTGGNFDSRQCPSHSTEKGGGFDSRLHFRSRSNNIATLNRHHCQKHTELSSRKLPQHAYTLKKTFLPGQRKVDPLLHSVRTHPHYRTWSRPPALLTPMCGDTHTHDQPETLHSETGVGSSFVSAAEAGEGWGGRTMHTLVIREKERKGLHVLLPLLFSVIAPDKGCTWSLSV